MVPLDVVAIVTEIETLPQPDGIAAFERTRRFELAIDRIHDRVGIHAVRRMVSAQIHTLNLEATGVLAPAARIAVDPELNALKLRPRVRDRKHVRAAQDDAFGENVR